MFFQGGRGDGQSPGDGTVFIPTEKLHEDFSFARGEREAVRQIFRPSDIFERGIVQHQSAVKKPVQVM